MPFVAQLLSALIILDFSALFFQALASAQQAQFKKVLAHFQKQTLIICATSIKLTTSTKIMIEFHFQRFEFVLQLWFILLTFLVCFGSNQCLLTTSECNAMSALQTSFNLPTSITNYGNNPTNPCSKKKQTNKNKNTHTYSNKIKQTVSSNFFFQLKFKKSFYFCYVKNEQHNFYLVFIFDRLERSDLQFFTNSNNSNQLERIESHRNNSNSNWIDDFIDISVRRKKRRKERK